MAKPRVVKKRARRVWENARRSKEGFGSVVVASVEATVRSDGAGQAGEQPEQEPQRWD